MFYNVNEEKISQQFNTRLYYKKKNLLTKKVKEKLEYLQSILNNY